MCYTCDFGLHLPAPMAIGVERALELRTGDTGMPSLSLLRGGLFVCCSC